VDRSWIKTLYKLTLHQPILLQGLTRLDPVAAAVTRLLRGHWNPTKFAECYSPYFPDYVIGDATGLCRLPRCEFHVQTHPEPHVILVAGCRHLLPAGAFANYEVFTTILRYAKALGCSRVVSYGGFMTERPDNSLYIAATSRHLAAATIQAFGGTIFPHGRIGGPMGLTLGLAHRYGLQGVGVLKPLADAASAEVTALAIFNYLLHVLAATTRDWPVE
jgi:proteasome assembly chaperone (PAC2) family protein